jgi:hypothetical protein
MLLHLDGRTLAIAQLGPDFLILKDQIEHPPAEAEIAVSIDGHERCWRVRLDEGIQAKRLKTPVSDFRNGSALA